jgi:hypothetical protein
MRRRKRDKGASLESGKNACMENPPRRASVDSQRLVQRVVDRGAVVSKFLPRHLFSLGFVKMGWQRAGVTRSWSGRAATT